jgi:hypothetical protein
MARFVASGQVDGFADRDRSAVGSVSDATLCAKVGPTGDQGYRHREDQGTRNGSQSRLHKNLVSKS